MNEPRVIRVPRLSGQTVGIFPRCERCERPLERRQIRWCGANCRTNACRQRLTWARKLEQYWQAK